jgi:hypothetical protein
LGINVRHEAGLAPAYAPLAQNAGIGGLLEAYANFVQPERMQQQQFLQQGRMAQFDLAANAQLGQQRAQQQAELQRQQNLQGLQAGLIRGQQGMQSQLLGGQIQSRLQQQRGQQQFGLADFETRQRLEAMRLQDQLLRGRSEAAGDQNLFQYGIQQQDQEIRRFRQSPGFQQAPPDVVRQFDALTQKRNALLTNRRLMPEERSDLLNQNWQEYDKLITSATRQPDPVEIAQQKAQEIEALVRPIEEKLGRKVDSMNWTDDGRLRSVNFAPVEKDNAAAVAAKQAEVKLKADVSWAEKTGKMALDKVKYINDQIKIQTPPVTTDPATGMQTGGGMIDPAVKAQIIAEAEGIFRMPPKPVLPEPGTGEGGGDLPGGFGGMTGAGPGGEGYDQPQQQPGIWGVPFPGMGQAEQQQQQAAPPAQKLSSFQREKLIRQARAHAVADARNEIHDIAYAAAGEPPEQREALLDSTRLMEEAMVAGPAKVAKWSQKKRDELAAARALIVLFQKSGKVKSSQQDREARGQAPVEALFD